jgi:hypothetical protein
MDAQIIRDTCRYLDSIAAGQEAAEREYMDALDEVLDGIESCDPDYKVLCMRGADRHRRLADVLYAAADYDEYWAEPWRLLMLAANGRLNPAEAAQFLRVLAHRHAEIESGVR